MPESSFNCSNKLEIGTLFIFFAQMIRSNDFQFLFKGTGQGEGSEGRGHAGDMQGEHQREGQTGEANEGQGHNEGHRYGAEAQGHRDGQDGDGKK